MEQEKMRNIIVLKNLPSNLIEEAFVIVKNNKMAKQLQNVKGQKQESETVNNTKKYMIKEAEMIISNYINEIENIKKETSYKKLKKRYKNLKITNIVLICTTILAIIL